MRQDLPEWTDSIATHAEVPFARTAHRHPEVELLIGDTFTDSYREAIRNGIDVWVPANGGTEEITTYPSGRRALYCFNPALGEHRYIDLDTDLILEDEEVL